MHIQLCLSLDFYLFYLLLDSCDKKTQTHFPRQKVGGSEKSRF